MEVAQPSGADDAYAEQRRIHPTSLAVAQRSAGWVGTRDGPAGLVAALGDHLRSWQADLQAWGAAGQAWLALGDARRALYCAEEALLHDGGSRPGTWASVADLRAATGDWRGATGGWARLLRLTAGQLPRALLGTAWGGRRCREIMAEQEGDDDLGEAPDLAVRRLLSTWAAPGSPEEAALRMVFGDEE